MAIAKLDGNRVLYHFLQKELQRSDYWLFQMMVARLIASLAIWFSPDTYRAMPILVPYAVRDPDARGNKSLGIPDQWGSPNAEGYFKDDNSLVKGLPRPLVIDSPVSLYDGRSIGKGFVASHVWREMPPNSHGADLASRHPLTYSFVPNLVWLPAQVASLTDREGSFAQQYLQAISISLYRDVSIDGPLARYTQKAWKLLSEPVVPALGVPPAGSLCFFRHESGFVDRRKQSVLKVVSGLALAVEGRQPSSKIVSSRYTVGLESIPRDSAHGLQAFLEEYLAALEA